jgi:hypothetical protein
MVFAYPPFLLLAQNGSECCTLANRSSSSRRGRKKVREKPRSLHHWAILMKAANRSTASRGPGGPKAPALAWQLSATTHLPTMVFKTGWVPAGPGPYTTQCTASVRLRQPMHELYDNQPYCTLLYGNTGSLRRQVVIQQFPR